MKNIKDVKCFLLDLDGTIYIGNKMIDGAMEFLKAVKSKGKKYCFLTNNSSRSTKDYLLKLSNKEIFAEKDEVLTSGYSAINFLNKNYYGKKVFLMGTQSLKNEFLESGITLTEEKPDIVMISYDTELTYEKLNKTCRFINEGALYFATHPDINCPSEEGFMPDAGSFMALIEKSMGKIPSLICGKPYKIMASAVKERFNLNDNEIAMVGDRLSTDTTFAINCGFVSVLVLSGETNLKMLKESGLKPDLILNSIKDLTEKI